MRRFLIAAFLLACAALPARAEFRAVTAVPDTAINVKAYGAIGNGSTDDTAAIQAAINAAQDATPGYFYDYVVFPSGSYCIRTAGGVTATGARMKFVGHGNPIIKVCGAHDTTVLTLNGAYESIDGIQIQGYNSPTVTQDALVIGSSCTNCFVGRQVLAQYGFHAISNAAGDAQIRAVAIDGYGPALVSTTKGAFFLRNKFDQPYPTGTAPTAPFTMSAWVASHTYATNDLATIASGAWVIQATTGCTSSGSEPAVAAYGSNMTNGSDTCVWQLAGPNPYYALRIDSGASPTFVDKLDCTGSFTYCVGIGVDGGAGPQLVTLREINAGTDLSGGVDAEKGQGLFIEGGSAGGCVLAGCKGVKLASTWGEKTHIGGGFIAYSNPVGISVEGGVGALISGASVHGASTACVNVAAGVTKFAVENSDFSTGSTWGTCTIAVNVASGASDYYKIIGNIMQGATAGVTDNGSGTHKTILGNE